LELGLDSYIDQWKWKWNGLVCKFIIDITHYSLVFAPFKVRREEMSSSSVILVNSLLIVSKTPTLKNHHQFTCIKLRLLTLKLVVDIFDGREKKTLFTNQYQLRKKK
jgi:hypothetical protein